MTDQIDIDELIERAQREIDLIDGYTRMATTAHDLLDEAITALRQQQEKLAACQSPLGDK